MNKMRTILVAIAVLLGASLQVCADDVVYTPANTPEDRSNIEVSGHAEMLGVDAFRHLWAWYRFDDAGNLLVNDVSDGPSLRPVTVGSTEECSESYFKQQDPGYRGSACQFYGNYTQALKLKTSELPDCICSGSGEFTISGWFRVSQSSTNAYVAIYYIGNLTNSNDKAQMRLLSNGNIPGRYVFDRGGTSSNWDDCWGAYGAWINWTIVRKQTDKEVIYNAYTNGVSIYMKSHTAGLVGKDLVSDDEGLLIGGALSNGANKRFLRSGNLVDEVMIFDKALSDDEVAWVAEHTKPYEFSAGWDVSDEGSLDLYGSLGHMIRGYGCVTADSVLSLTNDADAYFGGTIDGNGLVYDPSTTTATQVLSGASMYVGKTEVKAGTLLVQPLPQVPAALKDGLIGFWTFDDPKNYGRDLSGTGNHLYPSADVFSEPVPSEVPGGGRMMDFPFDSEEAATHRWVLRTKNVPIGLEGAATGDIGTNVSIVVWARPRPPFAVNRTGLFGFSNCKGPALSFANQNEAKTLTFGQRDVGGAGSWSAPASIVDSVHMFAVTYDVSLADTADKDRVTKLYYDGEFKANKASYKSGIKAANGKFALGESVFAGGADGSVRAYFDQAMLYNRPLTASEIGQLYAFGRHPVPTSATGVLPAATELAVSSGATAAFENANETVAAISGAGTIVLAASAKLTVTGTVGFTGAATGAGKLALGDDLAWAVETDEKGCARAGKYTYFTVPAAMLDEYSTANWTTAAPLRRGGEFHVVAIENGDDVTFKATVTNPGLMILVR